MHQPPVLAWMYVKCFPWSPLSTVRVWFCREKTWNDAGLFYHGHAELYGKEGIIKNPPIAGFIEYQRLLKGFKWYGQEDLNL
jgi:hypothetical protein